MKNLLKIVAGLMLVSSFAFANNDKVTPNKVEVKSFKMAMYFDQSSGVVKTFYEKDVKKNLRIEIRDSNGNVLAKDFMGKKRNTAQFNFDISRLEKGIYTLEVSIGDEVVTKTIGLAEVERKRSRNYKMELM